MFSNEKALLQDEQHPRRRAFYDSIPKRLKAEKSHKLASKTCQLTARHKLEVISSSLIKQLYYFELAPLLDKKFANVPRLNNKDTTVPLLVLYIDGSALNGTDKGGLVF